LNIEQKGYMNEMSYSSEARKQNFDLNIIKS